MRVRGCLARCVGAWLIEREVESLRGRELRRLGIDLPRHKPHRIMRRSKQLRAIVGAMIQRRVDRRCECSGALDERQVAGLGVDLESVERAVCADDVLVEAEQVVVWSVKVDPGCVGSAGVVLVDFGEREGAVLGDGDVEGADCSGVGGYEEFGCGGSGDQRRCGEEGEVHGGASLLND